MCFYVIEGSRRGRKLEGGSFTRLACTNEHTHTHTGGRVCATDIMHFQEKGKKTSKHRDLELPKFGEGNVNTEAGSGEIVCRRGMGT